MQVHGLHAFWIAEQFPVVRVRRGLVFFRCLRHGRRISCDGVVVLAKRLASLAELLVSCAIEGDWVDFAAVAAVEIVDCMIFTTMFGEVILRAVTTVTSNYFTFCVSDLLVKVYHGASSFRGSICILLLVHL